MKKILLPCLIAAMSFASLNAYSQPKQDETDSSVSLGLAGDNLDLYAVMDLFQKSKTIEAFEKSLNDDKDRINNLDLNLDKKVDFIKVITKKDGNSYQFILRVDVNKTESQDVAVILLDKDKDGKISLQCVGDEELYGKDYIIEPKGNSSVTPNPAYKGPDPVTKTVEATSTTVVVQQAPVVQYVYSPAYVPYAPPYYYGYYPPWFGFMTVMAVGIYRSNHYYHCGGYYGGHYHGGNNNVIINTGNRNNINHYNNSNRARSTTVSNNQARGNYGNGSTNMRGGRPTAGTQSSNRAGAGTGNRAGTQPSAGNRAGTQPSAGNRASTQPSASNRQSSSSSRPSAGTSNSSRSSSGSYGGGSGGGRSMGGGGSRMGGGGGRRR